VHPGGASILFHIQEMNRPGSKCHALCNTPSNLSGEVLDDTRSEKEIRAVIFDDSKCNCGDPGMITRMITRRK
jgi:hypothetical protein